MGRARNGQDLGWPRVSFEWNEARFLHWSVPQAVLRGVVPPTLELDTLHGEAWLSVVAFRMEKTRLAGFPLGSSSFVELNLRTYVRRGEETGVYFLSLDATDPLFVGLGRRLGFGYRRADITLRPDGVTSTPRQGPAFGASWRVGSSVVPDARDAFLCERYRAMTESRMACVSHAPWALQKLEATVTVPDLVSRFVHGPPDVAHALVGVTAQAGFPRRA